VYFTRVKREFRTLQSLNSTESFGGIDHLQNWFLGWGHR